MKILNHPAVIALGGTTLYLLPIIAPLISPNHLLVYHLREPAFPVFGLAIAILCMLWLLLTGILLFAQRLGRLRVAIWSGIILSFPWILLKNGSVLFEARIPHWLSLGVLGASAGAFAILMAAWRPSFLPLFEHVRSFIATLLGFASLSGIVIFGQLLWFAWQARALNAPLPLHDRQFARSASTPRTKVVWIVFDELSYQQVYAQRLPGLDLPAFDQLAAQSTIFTQVAPAGIYTERVLPSLMTGLPVDHIRSSSGGRLSLHTPAPGGWQSFDPHQTIFQDALDAGYSTGVAGWYNPYCRILPQVLDRCFWTVHSPLLGGTFDYRPFSISLLGSAHHFLAYALRFLRHSPPDTVRETELHIGDYSDLVAAGDKLLTDSTTDFIFLHMPVPHPLGIYNRNRSVFTTGHSSYIDNLALADRYLAHVRQVLQQQGQWDSSTIVVMGDHSWRTKLLWAASPTWTAEDQAASHGGQFDDRPGYIVKLPHQQQAAHIDGHFAAIHTRALLDAIISNRVTSSAELSDWVRKQGLADPR